MNALANGRDKSGPYNIGNKLPFFSQRAIYMESRYFLVAHAIFEDNTVLAECGIDAKGVCGIFANGRSCK